MLNGWLNWILGLVLVLVLHFFLINDDESDTIKIQINDYGIKISKKIIKKGSP